MRVRGKERSDRRFAARARRSRSRRAVAGVAGGLAEHLDVPVLRVRAVFAVLAASGGAGILGYLLLWVFIPQEPVGEAETTPRERQQAFALLAAGVGLALFTGTLAGGNAWVVGPFVAVLLGVVVVWREADESRRQRWREGARSGIAGVVFGAGGRAAVVRVCVGVVLVTGGIAVFVGRSGISDLQFALLSVLATLVGAAVLTLPWWLRLVRDLNVERSTRIRTQERAEIAAHLHDSVLQTLALIQKQAGAEREVRRLARGQERELRTWLYGPSGYGNGGSAVPSADPDTDVAPGTDAAGATAAAPAQRLSEVVAEVCGEVEDGFAITVQQVVVGDTRVDDKLSALVAAAREAIVNAGKHAGVSDVSVYAEVEPDRVQMFVRDRGSGFDPDTVGADRHGLADSIRGRMERHGGHVRLRTEPGGGTEVQLEMPNGSTSSGSAIREAWR